MPRRGRMAAGLDSLLNSIYNENKMTDTITTMSCRVVVMPYLGGGAVLPYQLDRLVSHISWIKDFLI